MRQDVISMGSGWHQEWFTYAPGSVRLASGWRRDDVRKMSRQRQYGVRMASGNVMIVQLRQERVRMRQDAVRMASEWRQGASGWRQAGVTGVSG